MRKVLQVLLVVFGVVDILIGLSHVLVGVASTPGGGHVNDTMDGELRFYAVLFIAYGAAVLWCVPDVERKIRELNLLSLVFFVGGIGRLISFLFVGHPHWFFQIMLVVELLFPLLLVWLGRRVAVEPEPARPGS